jgi:lipopolysaccharide transport system permease protein
VLLTGIALAASVLNVIYRDMAYLVSTGLSLVYWLTPVVYPPSMLPERWRALFAWNPLSGVMMGVRDALLRGTAPSGEAWLQLVVPTLLVLLVGVAIFRRHEREMLDHV